MEISMLGCGWLGLPLAEAFVADGHRVRGSTTSPDKLARIEDAGAEAHLIRLAPELERQPGDFFSSELLIVTVPPKGGETYLQQLAAIVEAARRGAVRWLIFTSSTSVYEKSDQTVTEDDPNPPDSERGQMLRDAEAIMQRPPLDTTVLRLGGLFGGDRNPGAFLAGRTDVGGANAPVNLVHRADVIGVIRSIIAQDVRRGVFNVVADEHPTKRSFYRSRAKNLGLEPPTFSSETARYKIVSNEKVKNTLGYTFQHQPTV